MTNWTHFELGRSAKKIQPIPRAAVKTLSHGKKGGWGGKKQKDSYLLTHSMKWETKGVTGALRTNRETLCE